MVDSIWIMVQTFECKVLDVAVVADNGDLLGEAPDRMRGKDNLQHPSVPLHQLQNGGADLKRGDLHTPIGDHALNKGGTM